MKGIIITITFFAFMTTAAKASDSTSVLHYLVREPVVKSAHPPVLILLHGVGSNEQDLFSLADRLPDDFLVISARAPIRLGDDSFAWYQVDFSTGKPVFNFEQEEKSRALLIKFIDQIKAKESVTMLSNMLRKSLMQGKVAFVSLEEEIEVVTNYLNLEKIRFEERLQVEWKIDDSLLKLLQQIDQI